MDYKKAFYNKLEGCYLGAKIKQTSINSTAQSGWTNLLHIKAQYFAHIKAHLQSRINELVGDDSIESNDIYNKLYTFFDSYLNEIGTPFFTDTPIYKNIYAKIYTNSKDTSLFYKTQNLYYVKSDTLYQSLTLQDNEGRFSIFFDASEYRQNADNNKSKVVFKLDSIAPIIASERGNPQDENPTHPLTPSAKGGGTKDKDSANDEGKAVKASAKDIESANAESVGIESCEYHNGEILNLESIDLAKYPKLKNLIWWE